SEVAAPSRKQQSPQTTTHPGDKVLQVGRSVTLRYSVLPSALRESQNRFRSGVRGLRAYSDLAAHRMDAQRPSPVRAADSKEHSHCRDARKRKVVSSLRAEWEREVSLQFPDPLASAWQPVVRRCQPRSDSLTVARSPYVC